MVMDKRSRDTAIAIAAVGCIGSILLGAYVNDRARKQKLQVAFLVDRVMEILKDGRWHNTNLIARSLDQPRGRVMQVLRFFEEFHFVTINETGEEARLDGKLTDFLDQLNLSVPPSVHS